MSNWESHEEQDSLVVAIVGMAGRFPGAANIETFWHNLRAGVESIRTFDDEELATLGVPQAVRSAPNYVKAAPVLDEIDRFDAAFFGYAPSEAEVIDPQHRLFLECAWTALEDAGYNPETYPGLIGVIAGTSLSTYLLFNLLTRPELSEAEHNFPIMLGNDKDFLSTRLSYHMNLRGPSIDVQTGCSTSLVAVHLACQHLLSYQCDMVLAGGVSLHMPQRTGYHYHEGGIVSPDGHCRAFDANAQGTVFGSGVGVVALKRLEDALADGDTIYAVIRGSAINNDGALKVGYTAPSVEGQAEVIARAHALADVNPASISYVETHGTGTLLGDPIEVTALAKAFNSRTSRRQFCALGSVKSNIGHLDAAAGIAGLIKTVLALKHKELPPTLHVSQPNPAIDWASSPFYVNTTCTPWPSGETPRRAGVSSFGIGGTNAHVILEEAPLPPPSAPDQPWHLLMLSAKSEAALEAATNNLAQHLEQHPEESLADIAYTLGVGRQPWTYRRIAVVQNRAEATRVLATCDPQRVLTTFCQSESRPIVFLFPGQGAQYIDMARQIYESEAVFRAEVDRCCELLKPHLGRDLRTILFPTPQDYDQAQQQLGQTVLTQPALFVVEYALARQLQAWGIQPQALLGHSIGEYVAATLAEVFTLEDALMLVAARGRLMQRMPGGRMLSVALPAAEVEPLLGATVALAAINGPEQCVVSGPDIAIEQIERVLTERGATYRPLHTSHAFHSAMMEPAAELFLSQVRRVTLRAPQIPFISNVSGTWITEEQSTSPNYWAQQLCQPVQFERGLAEVLGTPAAVLVEVGPGRTLSTLARQHPARSTDQIVMTTLRHAREHDHDRALLLRTLGGLWLHGVAMDWAMLWKDQPRRRVSLPTYPFQRQRYWIEPSQSGPGLNRPHQAGDQRSDLGDWFYLPMWKPAPLLPPVDWAELHEQNARWLVFQDETGLSDRLVAHLRTAQQAVVTVSAGRQFAALDDAHYSVDPDQPEHYHALIAALTAAGWKPSHVLHLWGLTDQPADQSDDDRFAAYQAGGFYSLTALAQALAGIQGDDQIQIRVLANGVLALPGDTELEPTKATVLGACAVIPQEYPQLRCAVLDLRPSAPPPAALLLADCVQPQPAPLVAYRAAQRWLRVVTPVPLPAAATPAPTFRSGGRYLVTAAHTPLGQAVAAAVAAHGPCTLVLPYPPATPAEQISQAIQALARPGCTVLPQPVDLADPLQVQALRAHIAADGGPLHGLLYVPDRSGPPPFRLLAQTTPASAHPQLTASLHELRTLHAAFASDDLDLWHVHGSLATVLGGLGLATYTAAHAALAAYAQQQRQRGAAWSYIGWDVWQDGHSTTTGLGATVASLAIRPDEGQAASARLWHAPVGDILVATADLDTRLAQWANPIKPSDEAPSIQHQRPGILGLYQPPQRPIEQQIATIWQEVLGIAEIGLHDNFFELGGHSLLATRLLSRMRSAFDVEVSLQHIFEAPTIAELARAIEDLHLESIDETVLATLVTEIEVLSYDEIQVLLVHEKLLSEVSS